MGSFCARALLICSLFGATLGAAAQSADTAAEVRQAKAYALIEDALRDARDLHSPENKLLIYSKAAGLLWKRDPKHARELCAQFAGLYQQMLAEPKHPGEGPIRSSEFNSVRQMVATGIAPYDPEMALDFAQKTAGTDHRGEAQMNTLIANELAALKPKEALKLEESTLASGDFSGVPQMVQTLSSLDKDAAATLVEKMVARIASASADGEDSATYAAINLLQMDEGRSPKSKILTDAQRRSLVDSALNLLTMYARPMESVDPSTAALLQKYAPSAWQAYVSKASEQKQNSGESPAVAQFHEALRKNDLDAALTLLDQVPPAQRQQLAGEMIWRAAASPDASIANKLLNDYVTDDSMRSMFQHNLGNQQVMAALQRNDMSTARALLSESNMEPIERAQMELQMAQSLAYGDAKTKAQALGMIEEALQMVPDLDDSASFTFHAAAVQALANISPQRAAEVAAALIERTNQLMAPLQQVDGFLGVRQFSNGELRPFAGGFIEPAMNAVSSLAPNADQAITLANSFQAPELKARAKLQVAERMIISGANGPVSGRAVSGMLPLVTVRNP